MKRQPDQIRQFLLQTSVLDRLSGMLCDAVTGQDSGPGNGMLEALERANLFVVPLDDRRRWYRYHHLFADVLRARLLDEQPEQVPELHRRASAWYERNGERSEAIRHALAAGDFSKRRTSSSCPHRHCAEADKRPRCWAGSRHCRMNCSAAGRCSAMCLRESYWLAASSTTPTRACGMPSAGSDLLGQTERRAYQQGWWSSTKGNSAVFRVRSRCIALALHCC